MSTAPLVIQTKVDLSGFQKFEGAAASVNSATEKMAQKFRQAGLSADEVKSALRNMGVSAADAAAAVGEAGNVAQAAGEKIKYSMTDARFAAMGLGQELGLRLPRVLSTFLAHSQTVGPILAGAFAPIAVLALIEVLSRIPDVIEKIVGALSGWTEKAREAFNEQIKLNNEILEQDARRAGAIRDFNQIGKTGAEKYSLQLKDNVSNLHDLALVGGTLLAQQRTLTNELHDQSTGWNLVKNAAAGWLTGMDVKMKDWEAQLKTVTPEVNALTKELREMREVKTQEIIAERDFNALQRYRAEVEATIEGEKKIGDARAAAEEASARAIFALKHATVDQETELEEDAASHQFAIDRKAIEDRIALFKTEGTEKAAEVKTLTDELVALEIAYNSKVQGLRDKQTEEDKKNMDEESLAVRDYFRDVDHMDEQSTVKRIENQQRLARESIRIATEAADRMASEQAKSGQFGAAAGTIQSQNAANIAAIQALINAEAQYRQQINESNIELAKRNELIQQSEARTTALTNQLNAQLEKTSAELQKIQDQNPWNKMIQDMQRMTTVLQLQTTALTTFTNQLSTGLGNAFENAVTKGKNFGTEMLKVLDSILLAEAKFVIEWLAKKAEMWALSKVLDLTGATASVAAVIPKNVLIATSEAGAAAAAAFASAMETLPFPANVAVAPAVGSAALATGLGYAAIASQETGGLTLGAGLVMMHPQEVTMPRDVSTAFRNISAAGKNPAAAAAGGSSKTVHNRISIEMHNHGAMSREDVVAAVKKAVRQGSLD